LNYLLYQEGYNAMKITKKYLQEAIKEELRAYLKESAAGTQLNMTYKEIATESAIEIQVVFTDKEGKVLYRGVGKDLPTAAQVALSRTGRGSPEFNASQPAQ
tara:strand:- start:529 stop:834 length:306 start_codon:yes stop_codon:yes gene_type:complete